MTLALSPTSTSSPAVAVVAPTVTQAVTAPVSVTHFSWTERGEIEQKTVGSTNPFLQSNGNGTAVSPPTPPPTVSHTSTNPFLNPFITSTTAQPIQANGVAEEILTSAVRPASRNRARSPPPTQSSPEPKEEMIVSPPVIHPTTPKVRLVDVPGDLTFIP